MKISTSVSKERLRTHITYNAWKYIVLIVASLFGWNLLYAQTAYRSPQDKRIDVYIKSSTVTQEKADAFLFDVWQSTVPDMETVQSVIMTAGSDDYYGTMQLSVYIMAGEGDIYILTSDDFKTYASQGAFIALDDYIASGEIDTDNIELAGGYVAIQDDESQDVPEMHLYGIPADTLYGFIDGMLLDNRGMYLCVTAASGNERNVIPFLNGLIEHSRGEKPEWLE